MTGKPTTTTAAVMAELKELRKDLSAQITDARKELGTDIDGLRQELRADMKRLEDRLTTLEQRTPPQRVLDDVEARLRSLEQSKVPPAELSEVKKELAHERSKRQGIENRLAWYAGAIVGISAVISTLIAVAGLVLKN